MNKINEVNKIAIIGGGTSAWLAAAYLSHSIPHMFIEVIDKEHGSPVGVGEGTLLSFDAIMKKCGFEVNDWFSEIDATYKSGILFPGWGDKDDDVVWHPFLFPEMHIIHTTQLNLWSKHQDYDFKEYGLAFYDVSINHDKVDRGTPEAYAYHIDASKLVSFIQKKLEDRIRVTSTKSEVVDIIRKENNDIEKLILKNGREVVADLYIDCTGFRGILNNNPDRVNLEGRLFCDTAIAGRVPYEDKEKELHPYVISEKVEHGWVWNIPTQQRIGSGLVFSRKQTDIEEAKKFFCEYWDNRITPEECKVIDWTPYYNKNIWHNNVVSIGLSAGFIEPLESTGVALIIVGIEQLAFRLGSRFYTEHDVNYYNNLMAAYFEDCIDFVSMHYSVNKRKEKFWQWVDDTFIKSEKQKFYERQMLRSDEKLPVKGSGLMFCATNWIMWLIQLGFPCAEADDGLSKEQSEFELLYYHSSIESTRHKRSIEHTKYINEINQWIEQRK